MAASDDAQVTADLVSKLMQTTSAMSWDALPRVVIQAMEAVELVKGLSGDRKKALVVAGIQALIRKLGTHSNMGAADPILLALVPTLVDRLVAVSKQGIQINTAAATVGGCCGMQ